MQQAKLAISLLTLIPALVLVVPASAQDTAQQTYEPVGQVEISKTEMGFIVSVGGGHGVLKFEGHEYPFRVGGLGIGGTGVHSVNVTGDVYNLKNASDFEGRYGEVRKGVTLTGAHRGARQLENPRTGVIMTLRGTAEGIRLNTGAGGLRVSLE